MSYTCTIVHVETELQNFDDDLLCSMLTSSLPNKKLITLPRIQTYRELLDRKQYIYSDTLKLAYTNKINFDGRHWSSRPVEAQSWFIGAMRALEARIFSLSIFVTHTASFLRVLFLFGCRNFLNDMHLLPFCTITSSICGPASFDRTWTLRSWLHSCQL